MDIKAIIARGELVGCHAPSQPSVPSGKASATLDALVSYLEAICSEWGATPELERLAAVRLAADTAMRIQEWAAADAGEPEE
jgi:hypothetical protein